MIPMKLTSTRVWRVYTGGKLLDEFQGRSPGVDGFFPEEWVGSTTRAVNAGREKLVEGLSSCVLPDGTTALLKNLIAENPVGFLGRKHVETHGPTAGFLVKLLDSSVRLPIQAHPDRDFSRKYLNADYGKTECWVILNGREIDGPPHVLFGFQKGVTEKEYRRAYEEQNVQAMSSMLNRINVVPGDCFVIPGGVPHAIGGGVFLLEVQEPSDFVFQLDRKGPCWNLNDYQVHMNLGDEKMFEGFDFAGDRGPDIIRRCHRRHDYSAPGEIPLLPEWIEEYFGARRFAGQKVHCPDSKGLVVGICAGNEYHSTSDLLEIFETLPPKQRNCRSRPTDRTRGTS